MALPPYVQLKQFLEELLEEVLRQSRNAELGPFAQSPRFIQHEGDRLAFTTVDGDERELTYQESSFERTFTSDEIANLTLEGVIGLVRSTGAAQGAEESKYHFGVIDRVTNETGQVVSTRGEPVNHHDLLEMLDKLHMPFDDCGEPRLPTIVTSPGMREEFVAALTALEQDEGAKARFNEIVFRKKQEWDEETNSRKLVD